MALCFVIEPFFFEINAMPIYEYKCMNCHHHFELIEGVSDKRKKKCPECGKLKAERLVSLSGFQLKGSGWYADGYSKEKPAKKESSKQSETKPAKEKAKPKEH